MKNESYAARLERGFADAPTTLLADQVDVLTSENAALQKLADERLEQMTADRKQALTWKADAARYRWLRNSCSWEVAIWEAVEMAPGADLGQSLGQALDDSVNAAMAVQP